jgi:hypothetical protein
MMLEEECSGDSALDTSSLSAQPYGNLGPVSCNLILDDPLAKRCVLLLKVPGPTTMRDRRLHITSYYRSCLVHAESSAGTVPGHFHIPTSTDNEYTSPPLAP